MLATRSCLVLYAPEGPVAAQQVTCLTIAKATA